MITASVKVTLLFLSCLSLYLTRFIPGTKVWWQGLSQRKFDVFLFCLLFISVTFLVGMRSEAGGDLVDTNRKIRIVVILAVIMISWLRILTAPATVRGIPASIMFMLVYTVAAFLTATYSLFPVLTVWKSTEVFAHVSFAIMLARNTKTLDDARIVINLVLLALLFLVIETFWSALLFPELAFKQYLQFVGMAGLYPLLNLNTASQVGASLGIGALATIFSVKMAAARAVLIVITVSGIAVLLLAHSRTSLLSFGACIIIFALYARSNLLKVMTITGVVIGTIASTYIMTFLYRGQTRAQFESLTGRIGFWELVIEKASEAPMLGYGYYSGTRVLFNVPGADNTYLAVLLGGGIVLLSIFMIPIVIGSYHIYLSRPSKSREHSADFYTALWMQVAGLFTILLARSLTGPSFGAHHISLMLYLLTLIGAECLYRNRNNTEAPTIPGQPEPVYDKPAQVNSRILRRRRRGETKAGRLERSRLG